MFRDWTMVFISDLVNSGKMGMEMTWRDKDSLMGKSPRRYLRYLRAGRRWSGSE